MFKTGDIVKYAPEFCGKGEEHYIHEVLEVNPDTKMCLIRTINTSLTLGSTERVTFDMIEKASRYEVIVIHENGKQRYIITNTEDKTFFAGYDFMGSIDWVQETSKAYTMDYIEAYEIKMDIEDSDDEPEPENQMKLTKSQVRMLNSLAKENWERAQGMLDGMNEILGTKYGWLAKEVVWFENPDSSNKYAACHDALAWAED